MISNILEITFRGFWNFVGMSLIFSLSFYYIVNMVLLMWGRFMRMLMVRKHGWPPNHLDADGDFKTENK